MIKVLIVEDHPMVVQGLKMTIEAQNDFQLFAIAENGLDTLAIISSSLPDVIILDIQLPDYNGVELCKIIRKEYPTVEIIALTNHCKLYYIKSMLDAGAKGYLMKNSGPEEICAAVKAVFNGQNYYSPDVRTMLDIYNNKPIYLSAREQEILKLIAKGMTNHEIADMLFLSPLTVDSHRKNIISKLGVKNTAEMISYAYSNGLID